MGAGKRLGQKLGGEPSGKDHHWSHRFHDGRIDCGIFRYTDSDITVVSAQIRPADGEAVLPSGPVGAGGFSGWGRGSDWAKNLAVNPQVRITIGRTDFMTEGSIVESSDTQARILRSFQHKYGLRTVKLFYHLDRLELVAFPLDRTSEE